MSRRRQTHSTLSLGWKQDTVLRILRRVLKDACAVPLELRQERRDAEATLS